MNECFPLVILEAMEYKLPVISSNEDVYKRQAQYVLDELVVNKECKQSKIGS